MTSPQTHVDAFLACATTEPLERLSARLQRLDFTGSPTGLLHGWPRGRSEASLRLRGACFTSPCSAVARTFHEFGGRPGRRTPHALSLPAQLRHIRRCDFASALDCSLHRSPRAGVGPCTSGIRVFARGPLEVFRALRVRTGFAECGWPAQAECRRVGGSWRAQRALNVPARSVVDSAPADNHGLFREVCSWLGRDRTT